MKSKLFLSLSLLTAVFTQASNLSTSVRSSTGQFVSGEQTIGQSTKHCPNIEATTKALNFKNNITNAKLLGKAAAPFGALVGATLGAGYLADKYQTSAPEVVNIEPMATTVEPKQTYFESFKQSISNAKDSISNGWNQMTLENMKNGLSNAAELANKNRLNTGIAVATTALVGYGAYKLYRGDFSAQAKKQEQPKATPKVTSEKQQRNLKIGKRGQA